MKLGTARAIITPAAAAGTPLAGFAFRDHGAEAVLDDLEVRVLWFEDDETASGAVCIVTADVIGFDATLTAALRDAIRQAHNLPPERLLLCASHTHSGPQTCCNMLGVGALVPDVVATICRRIHEAVTQARHDLRAVTLHTGRGQCIGYAINRRLVCDGKVLSAPNSDGVRDDEVGVIACMDAEHHQPRAVLFHFACHPTTLGTYHISADYPGAARRHIEQVLGADTIASFLPGCFGDIRPNCTTIGGLAFRRGQAEDVAAFGSALGGAVLNVVHSAAMRTATPGLYGQTRTIDLPLARQPSPDDLARTRATGTPLEKEWAARLLTQSARETRTLALQRIDLAREISLVAMGGEICCDYGHYVKSLQPERFVLPLGYSNGIVGYIPSARMFAEGGYEVVDSTIYFGLPGPFQPSIDELIRTNIRTVLDVHG